MKKYVKIQSSVTINVTPGLQYEDNTDVKEPIRDKLKVNASWPKATVLIKQGQFWYPSEISEWNTVKSLQKDKILTIGEFTDDVDEEDVKLAKENLANELKEMESKKKAKITNVDLNKLTGE